MPIFRGKTGFFSLRSKERKEKTTKKKTKQTNKKPNKEGLGPSEVDLQKKQKNNKKIKQNRKTKKYRKMSFSVISQKFLIFWWVSKSSLFLTTWPRKRAPPKHYKNRGFSTPIFEKQLCITKRPFLDKKNKSRNSNYHFCLFSYLSTTKNTKSAETLIL